MTTRATSRYISKSGTCRSDILASSSPPQLKTQHNRAITHPLGTNLTASEAEAQDGPHSNIWPRRPLPKYVCSRLRELFPRRNLFPAVLTTHAPVSILLINAIAILSEDRFLARIGWSASNAAEPGFGGGVGQDQSVKTKIINLMTSIRTLMRSMSSFISPSPSACAPGYRSLRPCSKGSD